MSGARQDDPDRIFAQFARQRVEQHVDRRHFPRLIRGGSVDYQPAIAQPGCRACRNDMDMAGPDRLTLAGFGHRHAGPAPDDVRQHAFPARRQMEHHHERQSGIGRHGLEEPAEGRNSTCRGTNANDRKRGFGHGSASGEIKIASLRQAAPARGRRSHIGRSRRARQSDKQRDKKTRTTAKSFLRANRTASQQHPASSGRDKSTADFMNVLLNLCCFEVIGEISRSGEIRTFCGRYRRKPPRRRVDRRRSRALGRRASAMYFRS